MRAETEDKKTTGTFRTESEPAILTLQAAWEDLHRRALPKHFSGLELCLLRSIFYAGAAAAVRMADANVPIAEVKWQALHSPAARWPASPVEDLDVAAERLSGLEGGAR